MSMLVTPNGEGAADSPEDRPPTPPRSPVGARGRAREGPGRGGGVARAEVFHRPSDCEQVLKFLHAQLRKKFVRRALVACDSNGEEEEAEE